MRLIHLTGKRFEYLSADSIYISNLAEQFSKYLADGYLLIIGNKSPEQFKNINLINSRLSSYGNGWLHFWLPYIYYFFWLPYFILTQKIKNTKTIFFSSDSNLLLILIFWKKIFRLKFKICSDWHMLYNNMKDSFIPRNSDYLISTSEKLKDIIIKKSGINSNKINVVYGGVDAKSYNAKAKSRQELGIPENKKLVGYVGLFKTMGMEKGIKTMIAALPYLPSDIAMVFVGAKPGQSVEYQDYAKEIDVANRCIFIDMQPVEIIPSYEKATDVLVIPYPNKPHFRDWGFPMKVYEYMMSQRPIVYSNLDIIREVLADCAWPFKPDDPKSLADKINYVLSKENKAEIDNKVKMANKEAKGFSWERKSDRILGVLDNT
ncbi:glycosyltransferase [Patescibacteria group bacterium]|nr:glycosyltransferase [Patescibacteria group bacterium]MBU4600789.1 glycosyltransferase [Patescibacteria group bacterium]